MLAEDVLLDLGCEVMLAMRLEAALNLARAADIQFAVLDVNLGGGQSSYPVADILRERHIPFMFATGYGPKGLDPAYQSTPTLQKPYHSEDLARMAAEVFAGGSEGLQQ